jgi:heme a synthase
LEQRSEQLGEGGAVTCWLHYWAVVTICVSIVPVALGAQVTTTNVGLSDPDWPTAPWYLLLHSSWASGLGFLIEHSHRAAGYVIGCCAIVLAGGLWFTRASQRLRWLGALALGGVIIQGIIGGLRVRLHARMGVELAFVHGIFAQLVLAVLVCIAILTSRSWTRPCISDASTGESRRLRQWAMFTAALIYAQLVFGGLVRHFNSPIGQRAHLIVAFGVVAAVTWLGKLVWEIHRRDRTITTAFAVLPVVIGLQVMLGVETWIQKYSSGVLPELQQIPLGQSIVRTLHFVTGAAIFASSVAVAVAAHRQSSLRVEMETAPMREMEPAA